MVDVAPNHMASDDTAETVDYSPLNPFNDESYFHSVCWITDWTNQSMVEDVSRRAVSCFWKSADGIL
jgi:alpha-amylase